MGAGHIAHRCPLLGRMSLLDWICKCPVMHKNMQRPSPAKTLQNDLCAILIHNPAIMRGEQGLQQWRNTGC